MMISALKMISVPGMMYMPVANISIITYVYDFVLAISLFCIHFLF